MFIYILLTFFDPFYIFSTTQRRGNFRRVFLWTHATFKVFGNKGLYLDILR